MFRSTRQKKNSETIHSIVMLEKDLKSRLDDIENQLSQMDTHSVFVEKKINAIWLTTQATHFRVRLNDFALVILFVVILWVIRYAIE